MTLSARIAHGPVYLARTHVSAERGRYRCTSHGYPTIRADGHCYVSPDDGMAVPAILEIAADAAVARDPAAIRAAVADADARGIAVSPWLRRASERGMIARTLRS